MAAVKKRSAVKKSSSAKKASSSRDIPDTVAIKLKPNFSEDELIKEVRSKFRQIQKLHTKELARAVVNRQAGNAGLVLAGLCKVIPC